MNVVLHRVNCTVDFLLHRLECQPSLLSLLLLLLFSPRSSSTPPRRSSSSSLLRSSSGVRLLRSLSPCREWETYALQALCARIADVALCSALHIGVVETFAAVVGHDDRVGSGGWLRRRSVRRDSVSAGNRGVARLMSEACEVMVRVVRGMRRW